jgi:predicted transcriptional regulator
MKGTSGAMGLTTDYQLSALEAAIMELVWQRAEEITVREVWATLQPQRSLAYTTVTTVMSRLVPKGILQVRRKGKADYYRATGTKAELMGQLAQRAVHVVLEHFGDQAIEQFVREVQAAGPARLQTLRALLEQERDAGR